MATVRGGLDPHAVSGSPRWWRPNPTARWDWSSASSTCPMPWLMAKAAATNLSGDWTSSPADLSILNTGHRQPPRTRPGADAPWPDHPEGPPAGPVAATRHAVAASRAMSGEELNTTRSLVENPMPTVGALL